MRAAFLSLLATWHPGSGIETTPVATVAPPAHAEVIAHETEWLRLTLTSEAQGRIGLQTARIVSGIRAATGGDTGLLDARDQGFFTVAMPEFWQRPEMDGLLRDVREKTYKYNWLQSVFTEA